MNDIWTDGEGRPVPEPAVAGIGLGICLSILARNLS